MKKTSFLALLGKKFPEKLSGLSVKGGGYPPIPLRKIPLKSRLPLYDLFDPFLTLFNEKKHHF